HRPHPDTSVVNRLKMSLYGETDNHLWPKDGSWARGVATDLAAWQRFYRAVGEKTNAFPVAPAPQSPAADVLFALSKYDAAIEELRQASALPYSRFPLNYNTDRPFDILLPHLAAMKQCSQVLALRATAELEAGQTDKAFDDVKLSLRLIDADRGEPFLISDLVRIAELQIVLQPVWEGLAKGGWSDQQLGGLEEELGKIDFVEDAARSFRGERNMAIATVDSMRRVRSYYVSYLADAGRPGRGNAFQTMEAYLMPSGWFYENEIQIAQLNQQYILPMVDPARHEILPAWENKADRYVRSLRRRPWNSLASIMASSVGTTGVRYAHGQENVDLARIACALERYHLALHEYPGNLEALVPQFIDKIPSDVIGGGSLHYRLAGTRYSLYSIGWNGKDDDAKTVAVRSA